MCRAQIRLRGVGALHAGTALLAEDLHARHALVRTCRDPTDRRGHCRGDLADAVDLHNLGSQDPEPHGDGGKGSACAALAPTMPPSARADAADRDMTSLIMSPMVDRPFAHRRIYRNEGCRTDAPGITPRRRSDGLAAVRPPNPLRSRPPIEKLDFNRYRLGPACGPCGAAGLRGICRRTVPRTRERGESSLRRAR